MESKQSIPSIASATTARQSGHSHHKVLQERSPVAPKASSPMKVPPASVGSPSATKKIPGFLAPNANPLSLFFVFIAIKILSSEIHNSSTSKSSTNLWNSFSQALYNPDIINMLTAVSPYLDVAEQEGMYTIIGILEAVHILKGLQEGSYQMQRLQQIPALAWDGEKKGLGVIKALRDYMPENSRPTVDKAIKAYEAIERLSNNIKIYKNNIRIAGDHKRNPIEDIGEIIKVIKPIIPYEQQNKIDKLQKLIQIVQIMDLDEVMKNKNPNNMIQKEEIQQKDEIVMKKEFVQRDKNIQAIEQKNTTQNNAQVSTSSEEQSQSFEMLLKLIQLLSQSSDNKSE